MAEAAWGHHRRHGVPGRRPRPGIRWAPPPPGFWSAPQRAAPEVVDRDLSEHPSAWHSRGMTAKPVPVAPAEETKPTMTGAVPLVPLGRPQLAAAARLAAPRGPPPPPPPPPPAPPDPGEGPPPPRGGETA